MAGNPFRQAAPAVNPFRAPPVAAPRTMRTADGTEIAIPDGASPQDTMNAFVTGAFRQPAAPPVRAAVTEGPADPVVQALSGVNEGVIGDTLGAPVNAVTSLINLGGRGVNAASRAFGGEDLVGAIENPVMGSRWINSVQQDIGTVAPESSDPTMQTIRRYSRAAGGGLGMAVPLTAAAKVVPVAEAGAGVLRGAADSLLNLFRTNPGAATAGDVVASIGAQGGHDVGDAIGGPVAPTLGALLGGILPAGAMQVARRGLADIFAGSPVPRAPDASATPGDVTRYAGDVARWGLQGGSPEAGRAMDALDSVQAQLRRDMGRDAPSLPVTAAAVGDRPAGHILENAATRVPVPFNPVLSAQEKQNTAIAQEWQNLIDRLGGTPATGKGEIGELIKTAGSEGEQGLRNTISQAESLVERAIGPRRPVDVRNTLARIKDLIGRTDPTTGAALQAEAADLRAMAMAPPGGPNQLQVAGADVPLEVPWERLRDFRTNIGRRTQQGGLAPGYRKQIYAALVDDQNAALRDAPEDVQRAWGTLQQNERRLYSRELGFDEGGDLPGLAGTTEAQRSPLAVYREYVTGGFQDPGKLDVLMRNASPQSQADIRASILSDMGLSAPGRQSAAGNVFSIDTFLTNWNKLAPGSREVLFGGDRGIIDELSTLADAAGALKRRGGGRNFSNTAYTNLAGGTVLGGGAAATIGSAPALKAAGATYATLHGLASRRLAEWAAQRSPQLEQRLRAYAPALFEQTTGGGDDDLARALQGGQR